MYNSISETQSAIAENKIDCEALVKHYLKNIEAKKHLNAFLDVYEEEAIQRAKEIDGKVKSGKQGKLAGLVIGIKDTICYKDHPIQASSKILEGYQSLYSSTVVERLLAEDAIIIGRQNCDEFAMGASNENSAYGNVLNADDESRVPGGSSGGSAVSVQADMCLASLGSDTGGSVRQPAAFCGLVGLKPTYSRISRWGLIAYASSFDQIGILTKNIEDNAKILEVIAGADAFDATASTREVENYSAQLGDSGKKKIAYIRDCVEHESIQPEVKAKTLELITQLKNEGHEVEAVDFPYLDYMVPTYYILTTAEASSNLSRFDGVRYGHRTEKEGGLEEMYKLSRSEGFGEEVKRRIMLGTFVLSASYYDAYYTKAQKVRRLIKEKTEVILKDYDFILSPTTPSTAFKIGENADDPIKMYLADIFTVQASIAGLPAITIPYGKDDNGLSIGMQLVGKSFTEAQLFAFSQRITSN